MGLFDKIKQVAPTVGAAVAGAGAAATAGVYSAQAFAKDKQPEDETTSQKLNTAEPVANTNDSTSATSNSVNADAPFATPITNAASVDNSGFQTQVDESPESSYDPETGATAYQYANGSTLTEYADGSRAFYNASTGETTGYDASTDETFTQSSTVSTEDGFFSRIKEINYNIPDAMKAAGLGIPDQPVKEFRTYQEGSLSDAQVRQGYESRIGLGTTYSNNHTGRDEVAAGVGWNSEANYKAESFIGASSKGEVGAEWNSEEAHLYVQSRTMVGAEATVEASYKGTLDVEGINYKPSAEVQGYANAFAGVEAEGRGDLNISSDGARGNFGAEAFAGAKAEAGASGAMSIDGNDFARGEVGVNARAGIGAEFNVDAGYQDGQIQYGIDMGAAIGVGAGIQYQGSIDAPGLITHPEAVWASAVDEASSYIPEIPLSTDPSNYTNYMEQYVVQQVQEYVPVPVEIPQVVETISDVGDALEDLGSKFNPFG